MAQAPPFNPEPFGPYLLLAHLGRGGMADVYKARVEGVAGFARSVVVKRILRVHTDDPLFVDMFINEAKIAARLSHPNIVQVYELGEVDGELFMAMEYVRGLDLLRLLRTVVATAGEAALPPLIAAYVAREVCRGLGHAHEHLDENGAPRPIIHRDISPQNVMISFDGQVKVVDYGIAKAVTAFQEATMTGSLKGKFGYMAPEQIETGMCTAQTDLFSVGVMLHEILTGRRLFKGQTDYETMTRVKSGEVVPPSQVNPQIGARYAAELDRVTLTALQRNPAQRYQRATQMARDLDNILQDARFTVEDMVTWLRQIIPAGQRDETESQVLQLSRGTPSATGSPAPGTGTGTGRPQRQRTGAGVYATQSGRNQQLDSLGDMNGLPLGASVSRARGPQQGVLPTSHSHSQSQSGVHAVAPTGLSAGASPATSPRRLLVAGGAAAVFVGLLLGFGLYLRRPAVVQLPLPPTQGKEPLGAKDPPREPAKEPAATGEPSKPRAEAQIRLTSEPPGARVYAGPRLLGQTPVMVTMEGEALEVVLTLEGRPDLRYTLHRGDGPEVALRMDGRRRRKGAPAVDPDGKKPPLPGEGPKKIKVKALDDEDAEPKATKAVD